MAEHDELRLGHSMEDVQRPGEAILNVGVAGGETKDGLFFVGCGQMLHLADRAEKTSAPGRLCCQEAQWTEPKILLPLLNLGMDGRCHHGLLDFLDLLPKGLLVGIGRLNDLGKVDALLGPERRRPEEIVV